MAASLPPALRINVTGVTDEQMQVYEELSRCEYTANFSSPLKLINSSSRIEEQKHPTYPSQNPLAAVPWITSRSTSS